jgi:Ca-activated chloride channel homolog
MPGPVITRLPNRVGRGSFLSSVLICAAILAIAAAPLFSQSSTANAGQNPPSNSPSTSASQNSSAQSSKPNSNSQSKVESDVNDQGVFVFKKDVDEVLLHATVVDDHQHIVTNLDRSAFTVFEDGKQQNIISFRHEDIPVAMGIVIDNSGSMREKREKVNQAALNLVRSSNPQDEVFVVNFNDEYYLDQDFTNNLLKLKEALEKIDARGGTALYDAVVASADHLKRDARLDKKVLFVVTDGEDNASNESLEQAVRRLQDEAGPQVYAIGILGDEEHPKRARRALEIISERTGGMAFFPRTLDEVNQITGTIAHDIRSQYTIGYKPTNPRASGGFRTVKVDAKAKGHGKMIVRTKTGYYARSETASAASR